MELHRAKKKTLADKELKYPDIIKSLKKLRWNKQDAQDFVVLVDDYEGFVQVVRLNEKDYLVEYRDETLGKVYQSGDLTRDAVMEIFSGFFLKEEEWKDLFEWLDVTAFIGIFEDGRELIIQPLKGKKYKK